MLTFSSRSGVLAFLSPWFSFCLSAADFLPQSVRSVLRHRNRRSKSRIKCKKENRQMVAKICGIQLKNNTHTHTHTHTQVIHTLTLYNNNNNNNNTRVLLLGFAIDELSQSYRPRLYRFPVADGASNKLYANYIALRREGRVLAAFLHRNVYQR